MENRDDKDYQEWEEMLDDNQTAEEQIEKMKVNGGMSEAAMEADIAAEENPRPDYIDEQGNPHWFDEEEDLPYVTPFEVIERSGMLYAGSDRTSGYTYQIRTDDGLKDEIAPGLRELKENEHLFIEYRKWENGEENDYDFSAYIMQVNDDGTYSRPSDLNTKFNQNRIDHLEENKAVNAFKAEVRGFVAGYEEKIVKSQEDLSQSKADEIKNNFEYDGLTYIPVRQLTEEEKSLINNRTPKEIWENSIIEKPKNGEGYSYEEFIKNTQNTELENADLFYCIERGKFFTPVENGIINLNEGSIGEHFAEELKSFINDERNKQIINANRPLKFDKENDMKLMDNISSVLTERDVFFQKNETLSDVRVRWGNPEHNGLSHIIKRRMDKLIQQNGMSLEEAEKETSAILFLAVRNVSEAPATKETNGRYAVYKNGIKTAIDSDKHGNFIVTGFDFDDTKQEAADAIKSVNALYGYAPEFLEIYAQVGAAYASLSNTVPQQIPAVNEMTNVTASYSLEKSALNKAADLLKGMNFSSENYRDLLSVINKISEMNGIEKLVALDKKIGELHDKIDEKTDKFLDTKAGKITEGIVESGAGLPKGSIDAAHDAYNSIKEIKSELTTQIQEKEGEASVEKLPQEKTPENTIQSEPFDPKAKIIFGKTVLPTFAVLADGKLCSVENALVMSYDKNEKSYLIDSNGEKITLPKETFETLLKDKLEQERMEASIAEGKTIVFQDESRGVKGTVIPDFAMFTSKGLETFKDFVPTGFNKGDNTYTLSNGRTTINVTAERFKEITAPERFEKKFDENSPAWKKLCEQQYKDFFVERSNTAYNFKHNLAVYCRKEANSPCDALHLAKEIISKMSKAEQKKVQSLIKEISHANETPNEVIARLYHDSIKEIPLQEEYIKKYQPKNVIARPFYDTLSTDGQKVENDPALIQGTFDFNLKIGSSIKNVDIQTEKLFGKGKDSMHFTEVKVISASKEGNSITLMDRNKSFIKVPRDTFLSVYKEKQIKEMKKEIKQSHSNSIYISY